MTIDTDRFHRMNGYISTRCWGPFVFWTWSSFDNIYWLTIRWVNIGSGFAGKAYTYTTLWEGKVSDKWLWIWEVLHQPLVCGWYAGSPAGRSYVSKTKKQLAEEAKMWAEITAGRAFKKVLHGS